VARNRLVLSLFLVSVVTGLGVPPSNAQPLEKLVNWTAPPYWMPVSPPLSEKPEEGLSPEAVQAVPTAPLAFTGIPPCRVADTRGNGFSGQYGPPQIFTAGRTMTIANVCGIPATAQAISFNFSAVNIPGAGFLVAFPAGGAFPPTATIVYNQNTPNLSNAAVVPLGTGGAITLVGGVVPIDLVVDVNGYYAPNVVTSINGSTGAVTIPVLPSGTNGQTLYHNGTAWVANNALSTNGTDVALTGTLNFPFGVRVGSGPKTFLHATGSLNTFVGADSGASVTTGTRDTVVGQGASFNNTDGTFNTAVGYDALYSDIHGGASVAIGDNALAQSIGDNNTGVGAFALYHLVFGNGNIGLGILSGQNLTSGSGNLYLGNEGVASENNTIRIGSGGHNRMFVAGVAGSTVTGSAVLISGTGQLGIATSSARYKQDIADMADSSSALFRLRPVTFRYKGHAGDPLQYGLIAEEVEKVLPELVMKDSDGQPQTVLYHEMPAMLLNELQKQQRRIEAQDAQITRLLNRLDALEGRLSRR
jgi:Chaperone of endosialidase